MITANLYVTKGESKNIPLQAFNNAGAEIDLTSATIIFTVKESYNDVSPTFTRTNTAAGGNDNQVLVTSATDGLFLAKLSQTNTLALSTKAYYYDCQVNDGTNYVTHSGSLIVQQSVGDGDIERRTSGTTAQRPTLTSNYEDVGYMYFDTTLGSPVWWDGANWDDEV